ncbi:YebC/PmpR family DNA-binding transcriptional regulator [Ostreibacterium oceani]|uniref:Probable transcriptional regulatory protein GCU85_03995 n=1 Tax=Ostreibacterium oceani TaxID=2654998 RepID=A0A6N7ETL9_9GAMM|nr:YebC/PmpR family DNA-binding transcriptional regulator [Ostreibacterium oceani]MPV85901.1 YebC/PmpR family DNA-binding transcriptional regulator [Ostreibacterium oceani]
MAGHSKWANIKHKKAKEDAKRGKVFTRLIRELTVAARNGGSDPDMNPRLRLAVSKAQAANMPKDTMERAIKRGAGELDGQVLSEIRYEGYGPGGVAVMVDCLSDNRNRTVGEVRHAFSKFGGNLGTDGSVAFQFREVGILSYESADEDAIMEAALEAGAEDVVAEAGAIEVITSLKDYTSVYDAMVAAGFEPDESEITQRADNLSPVVGEDAEKLLKLLDVLEDLDDTQTVSTNADFPEDMA